MQSVKHFTANLAKGKSSDPELVNLFRLLSSDRTAEHALTYLISNDPMFALYNKGLALHNLGKYEKAIEYYDKALEIDPKYADAYYNRACSKVEKGDIDDGLTDLKKAIEINKESYIEMAKEDKDFESIRNDDRFKALISDHIQNN